MRKTIFRLRLWQTAVGTSKGNSGKLWKTLQDVFGEANGEISDAHNADDFAIFYQNKVDSVRSLTATSSLYDMPCRATPTTSELAPVTAEEVEKMIGSSPNKSCQLDPAHLLSQSALLCHSSVFGLLNRTHWWSYVTD